MGVLDNFFRSLERFQFETHADVVASGGVFQKIRRDHEVLANIGSTLASTSSQSADLRAANLRFAREVLERSVHGTERALYALLEGSSRDAELVARLRSERDALSQAFEDLAKSDGENFTARAAQWTKSAESFFRTEERELFRAVAHHLAGVSDDELERRYRGGNDVIEERASA